VIDSSHKPERRFATEWTEDFASIRSTTARCFTASHTKALLPDVSQQVTLLRHSIAVLLHSLGGRGCSAFLGKQSYPSGAVLNICRTDLNGAMLTA